MASGTDSEGEGSGAEHLISFEDEYQEIALNCFRYLDFKSFAEVDRLTIPEYELLMKAVRLKQVDMDYRIHMLAYLSFSVKAEKKSGKNKTTPIYKRFKKFYDYEKELQKVTGSEDQHQGRFSGIGKILRKEEDDG